MLSAFVIPVLQIGCDWRYRERIATGAGDLWRALYSPQTSLVQRARAAFWFAVLPAALLFLSTHRTLGFGDSWPVVPAACSLVCEGNVELSEYVAAAPAGYSQESNGGLPYSVEAHPDGIYSRYPSGMLAFAVPVAAGARLTGATLPNTNRAKRLERLEKWTAVWVAAASVGLFFLIALRLSEPGPALCTTALLASGSVFFSTVSHGLWQQGGVVFWSLLALLMEFEQAERPSKTVTLFEGIALGMMLPCRLSAALFVAPFGLWVFCRSPQRALVLALLALAAYVPWALFYLHIYGNLLGPSTFQMAGDYWSAQPRDSLVGVLFSPARGLFVYQPWLLLACAQVVLRWSFIRGENRPQVPAYWGCFCLVVSVLQLGLVSSWYCWWGGHCWGSRLLAELVPLTALLCLAPVTLLLRSRPGKMLLATLAIGSFLIHAAGVYRETCWEARVELESHPESLWSWSHAPFLMSAYKSPETTR
jgi:hypothetical protein